MFVDPKFNLGKAVKDHSNTIVESMKSSELQREVLE